MYRIDLMKVNIRHTYGDIRYSFTDPIEGLLPRSAKPNPAPDMPISTLSSHEHVDLKSVLIFHPCFNIH